MIFCFRYKCNAFTSFFLFVCLSNLSLKKNLKEILCISTERLKKKKIEEFVYITTAAKLTMHVESNVPEETNFYMCREA